MVFNSACRVLFQVKHGLPLLRFPCGFQSKAWWVMLVCSRHMVHVCPLLVYRHFLLWMVSVMGPCPILCQNSWLEMHYGHRMRRIWWRWVLMKTCSLWSNFLVHLQVSALYKRTDLRLLLNSLGFMRQLRFLILHTGLRVAKAWHALLTLALTSSSVLPVLVSMLPK